jgi:hypothetical protein
VQTAHMTALADLLLGKYFWRLYLAATTMLAAVITFVVVTGAHAPLWISTIAGWTAIPITRARRSRRRNRAAGVTSRRTSRPTTDPDSATAVSRRAD